MIWFCMLGGTSHLESFDHKPEIDKHADKTINETPHAAAVLESPFYRKNVRDFAGTPRDLMPKLYPTQIGFKKRRRERHRGQRLVAGGGRLHRRHLP